LNNARYKLRLQKLKENKKFWEELIAYSLIRHGPHSKRRVQQFFYCCACIRYRGNVSIEPALGTKTQQQQIPKPVPQACPARITMPTEQHQEQESGQPAQALNVNSASLNNMFRVVTAVKQIMTELNEAVSEEDKIVAITRTVINLMEQDGC
jgi:hypothetical protein